MNATTPVASTIRDGDQATIHIAGYISTDAAAPLETAFQQASDAPKILVVFDIVGLSKDVPVFESEDRAIAV